jgi:hypothetical protein
MPHGIPTESFMRALFAAHARPFAIKPLTLKMLLAVYEQDGALPESTSSSTSEVVSRSARKATRAGATQAGEAD